MDRNFSDSKTVTKETNEIVIGSVNELKQFLLEHADGTTIVSIEIAQTESKTGGEM